MPPADHARPVELPAGGAVLGLLAFLAPAWIALSAALVGQLGGKAISSIMTLSALAVLFAPALLDPRLAPGASRGALLTASLMTMVTTSAGALITVWDIACLTHPGSPGLGVLLGVLAAPVGVYAALRPRTGRAVPRDWTLATLAAYGGMLVASAVFANPLFCGRDM